MVWSPTDAPDQTPRSLRKLRALRTLHSAVRLAHMTTADQTARPDQQPRRRLALIRRAPRRAFRAKRPVQIAKQQTVAVVPDQTPKAPKPAKSPRGPSVWTRARRSRAARRAARRTAADQTRLVVSAGKLSYLLLLVFGLGLLGVISGGFLVGFFNVVDFLVRVVRVGDPVTITTHAGIPRTYVDPNLAVPALAYIGAGVIELASMLTAIATVLLRAAPWRVRAYSWLMFCGVLSASVWAGVEHAKSRGYPVQAGWFSGLWPLLVAASVHLFTVVRRWVFDPIARARQTARIDAQTSPAATRPAQTSARQTARPAPRTRTEQPKPDQTVPPSLRSIVSHTDADLLKTIRSAHPNGLPSAGDIKTALVKDGQTCGQTKALRLQKLLIAGADREQTADPEPAAAAAN